MAQVIRNFWIEASIDGRETKVTGGPRGKRDGFDLRIFMRNEGQVEQAVYISGWANSEGQLILEVDPVDHDRVEIRRDRDQSY